MELIIVRHAQPVASHPDEFPADPGLSEPGNRQAQALAEWFRHRDQPVDRLVVSPMRRARETAGPLATALGQPAQVVDGLAEYDLGAKRYIPFEQAEATVHEQVDVALRTGHWGEHRFDPDEFRRRVADAFADIAEAVSPEERVVVVCHGGVINSYLCGVIGRPYGVFFRPRYTGISRVAMVRDRPPQLVSLNEFPHAALLAPVGRPSP